MFGKQVSNFQFINRIHVLEGIVFELKETLRFYADQRNYWATVGEIENDRGDKAYKMLKKHNKTWDEIYQQADSEV